MIYTVARLRMHYSGSGDCVSHFLSKYGVALSPAKRTMTSATAHLSVTCAATCLSESGSSAKRTMTGATAHLSMTCAATCLSKACSGTNVRVTHNGSPILRLV